jgi:hypothetical protein
VHEHRKNEIRPELLDLTDELQIEIGKIAVSAPIEGVEQSHFMSERGKCRQEIRMLVSLAARWLTISVTPE